VSLHYTRLMALKEQIQADLATSMKARDAIRTDALRLLRAAIQNLEVARTDPDNEAYGHPVTEDDLVSVVQRQIKQRHDSIAAFRKAGRDELARKEETELRVLSDYLPDHLKQLSRDQIAAHVGKLIDELGRDFKRVMPRAAQELRGRADGRVVNEVVRELTA
jgi:uncharacterized protein